MSKLQFDASLLPDIAAELWHLVRQIPQGQVTSYKLLAAALGDATAARYVGQMMADHPHTADCACHRVICTDRHVGLSVLGSPQAKTALLAAEGVPVSQTRVAAEVPFFDQFTGSVPLARLQEIQAQVAALATQQPWPHTPGILGAVDLSYPQPNSARGVYVNWDTATGKVVFAHAVTRTISMPYISGYLSFRELTVLVPLVDEVRSFNKLAPIILVDGSGQLHPRKAGLAAHLGVLLDWPTIGVTKHALCGTLKPMAKGLWHIWHQESWQGTALTSAQGQIRKLYISPGHRVTAADATRVVQAAQGEHFLPEPIYWADRLSRNGLE